MTAWTEHLKKYAADNNMTYKDAMKDEKSKTLYNKTKPEKPVKEKKEKVVKEKKEKPVKEKKPKLTKEKTMPEKDKPIKEKSTKKPKTNGESKKLQKEHEMTDE